MMHVPRHSKHYVGTIILCLLSVSYSNILFDLIEILSFYPKLMAYNFPYIYVVIIIIYIVLSDEIPQLSLSRVPLGKGRELIFCSTMQVCGATMYLIYFYILYSSAYTRERHTPYSLIISITATRIAVSRFNDCITGIAIICIPRDFG